MRSVTSNAVNNVIAALNSKIKPDNIRTFTISGNGTARSLKITYSGNVSNCGLGFLILTRYAVLVVHVELDSSGHLIRLKKNTFVEYTTGSTGVTLASDVITITENYTWNSYVVQCYCRSTEIWNGLSFTVS